MALVLERAPRSDVGFQEIELYTLGKYHGLCVAKLSSVPGSGPIMHTDSVTSTAVTIKQAVNHALEVLRRNQWDLGKVDSLVIHQTSETTLDGAVREINRAVGKPVCHRGNTIYNVADRGNTATNVTKPCKVDTGAEFNCPAFVEIGDLIRIDTRTGEYVERVKE